MTRRYAIVCLAVSAFLFFAWIGVLTYLALTTSKPVVLSRPQMLASDLDVVAQVDSLEAPVSVVEVRYAAAPDAVAMT